MRAKSKSSPCQTKRDKDGVPTSSQGKRSAGLPRIFTRKTKRPRLDLSLGTSVDQPSPKCCSIANVFPTPSPVNGSSVPDMARTGSMDNRMKARGLGRTFGFRAPIDSRGVLENNGRAKISTHPRGHMIRNHRVLLATMLAFFTLSEAFAQAGFRPDKMGTVLY